MPNPTRAFAVPIGQPTRRREMTDAEATARAAQESKAAAAAARTVVVVVDDGVMAATTEEHELQKKPSAADLAAVKTRIALREGVNASKVTVTAKS